MISPGVLQSVIALAIAGGACTQTAYPIAVYEPSGALIAVSPPERGRDTGAVVRFAHALWIGAAPIAGCLLGADRVDTDLIDLPDDGERY